MPRLFVALRTAPPPEAGRVPTLGGVWQADSRLLVIAQQPSHGHLLHTLQLAGLTTESLRAPAPVQASGYGWRWLRPTVGDITGHTVHVESETYPHPEAARTTEGYSTKAQKKLGESSHSCASSFLIINPVPQLRSLVWGVPRKGLAASTGLRSWQLRPLQGDQRLPA